MSAKSQSVVTYLKKQSASGRSPRKPGEGRIYTPPVDETFIGKHRNNPNGEEAVRRYAEGQWNELNADLLRQAEMDCADIDKRVAHSEKCLRDAERKLAETSRYIKRSGMSGTALANGNLFRGTSVADWELPDKIMAGVGGAMAVILMIMGMVNASSLMLNSATTVFLDHPWMAMILSFLVPAASMSVKAVYDVFDTEKQRKRYAWIIYLLAFLLFVVWIILFSSTYGGLTDEIDWAFEETSSNSKGPWLTAAQLSTEIVSSAALFIFVSSIATKYSGDVFVANPEWEPAYNAKVDCETTHRAQIEDQKKAYGFRDELHASRFVFVERCAADWFSLQGRSR